MWGSVAGSSQRTQFLLPHQHQTLFHVLVLRITKD